MTLRIVALCLSVFPALLAEDALLRDINAAGSFPIVTSDTKAGEKPVTPSPKPEARPDKVVEATLLLAAGSKTLTADAFAAQVRKPVPAPIKLAPAATTPLRGREIAERAAAAHVRAGWVYQCTRCSHWHKAIAGGYPIGSDIIVTAHHVMDAPPNMQAGKGHPIVLVGEDRVLPVRSVVAADQGMDTIILRVEGASLKPLGINGDIRPGDPAFCFSDPLGRTGYFSQGIVNRIYTLDPSKSGGSGRRLNVSTDWAQGSSGAAVLDECGNIIGHVARIEAMLNPKAPPPAANGGEAPSRGTVITLHEAVPASGILTLIKAANDASASKP